MWIAEDSDKLRYLLFQAFTAAEYFAKDGEPYASIALLRDKFKIKTFGNKVIASPRRISPLAAIRAQIQQKVVIREIYETAEIIASLSLHKATEIVFEGVDSNDVNLPGLYAVAQRHGYYMLPAQTHLTFSKKPEDEELAWTPDEAV